MSAYLFLLHMQILAYYIKNSSLKGISIAGKVISLSLLADDTTLFLQDRSQIDTAIKLIDKLSAASGLKLNLFKCELLPVKAGNDAKVSLEFRGVIIVKDQISRIRENFNPHYIRDLIYSYREP